MRQHSISFLYELSPSLSFHFASVGILYLLAIILMDFMDLYTSKSLSLILSITSHFLFTFSHPLFRILTSFDFWIIITRNGLIQLFIFGILFVIYFWFFICNFVHLQRLIQDLSFWFLFYVINLHFCHLKPREIILSKY